MLNWTCPLFSSQKSGHCVVDRDPCRLHAASNSVKKLKKNNPETVCSSGD